MKILQLNTTDIGGGAAKVAWDLHSAYKARTLDSWLAVGFKNSDEPSVIEIPRYRKEDPWWSSPIRFTLDLLEPLDGKVKGIWRLRHFLRILASGKPAIDRELGHEDFNFPGSRDFLQNCPGSPNIIHAHNLHGGFFDLRLLSSISRKVPVILTLHDEWAMTGHCAYTLGCERWKSGCGKCPDLSIYPEIKRDATAWNWKRKRRIYKNSRLLLASPSLWLEDRVKNSMIHFAETRVIHNGVDLQVFHPEDRKAARSYLSLDQDATILLHVANKGKLNAFKDYSTIEQAVNNLSPELTKNRSIVLISLGSRNSIYEENTNGQIKVDHVPFQSNAVEVAKYYQAADVFLHAAKAENFPLTILESLACGTPVIATAIGGIPEQIREGETGFLVPPGQSQAMASRLELLLNDDVLRLSLSKKAAEDARKRFNLDRMVDEYLAWYQEASEKFSQGYRKSS